MQLEFLLEEESAEEALRLLLPPLLPGHTCRFRVLGGCQALLANLPNLLRGYAQRLQQPGQADLRIVVLLDADANCHARKQALETAAATAGLLTKTCAAPGAIFHVLNRVAVDELEAWLLGDRTAIRAAYPRIHAPHFKGLPRNPDLQLKSSQTLLRLLQKGGYFLSGKRKREWAAAIARQMNPAANESVSFRFFLEGLRALR